MNAEQLKGKWMQFKGELKQKWGKFTMMTCSKSKGTATSLSTKRKNGMERKRSNS